MTVLIKTINYLDAEGSTVEGIITADNLQDGDVTEGGVEADIDISEPEDGIVSLPPLTDHEIRKAEKHLYKIFTKAMKTDMSQPITAAHELQTAQALIELVGIAMEMPEMAKKFSLIKSIQINPCPPVQLERAMQVLEANFDTGIVRSVKRLLNNTGPALKPTHDLGRSRPS